MKSQDLHITLPKELLKKVDKHCEKNGYSRSEWIRHLLRTRIMEAESLGVGPKLEK